MNWFKEFTESIDHRQERLIKGIPTLLPFRDFPRLSSKIPGIIPGEFILITAATGEGKSRFVRGLLKSIVKFCGETGLEVKIILNSLEESREKVVSSLLASSLYKRFGRQASYYNLGNYSSGQPMPSQLREMIAQCEDDVNDFQRHVDLVHIANPYGMYVYVLKHLFDTGKFFLNDKQVTDFQTVKANSNNWNNYVSNNPAKIVIAVSDTIDAYIAESGKSKYETVIDFSKFFSRKILGIGCGVTTIFIQQQDNDLERIQQNFKGKTMLDKLKPGLDTLLTARATSQDASLAFGLFNPVKYKEFSYLGYNNLDKLKEGDFRSLILLKTREGEKTVDNEVPMIAYFGRDEFIELPLPSEAEKLKQYYK